jgi:putative ABC transport system ATP-binding protein
MTLTDRGFVHDHGGVLRVDGVTHRLGSTSVLIDVDVEIDDVGLVALAGRSGSGKSTLCHLIAGLGSPSAGRIRVGGQAADKIDDWALVSLLPQRLALVEELSLRENVLLPTVLAGRNRPEADAQRLLDALGLAAVADRPATATSLGEQQRAALARALVLRPRLAVLDEPTGHQDDANVVLVQEVLAAARDEGTTVLVATHDDRVLAVADQVVRLHGGRIVT